MAPVSAKASAHVSALRSALLAALALALTPSVVPAADLWNRSPAPRWDGSARPVAPAPIWSGLYVGGHIGSGFPDIRAKDFGSSNFTGDALAGGLHAGYNFSNGPWVTGLEFDATWSGMDGRRTFGATTVATEADLLASARGRIGYAHSFWHIYLTGGLAFGDLTTRFTSGGVSAADSSWRTGFVWGGGIEAKADTRVSIRLEALHYDFGSDTARTSVASSRVEADITTVRAGVTFHFN